MKKLLSTAAACGLFLVAGIANAGHHQMNSVCKPAWEHVQATHPQIEAAIKANDATKVGQLIIADHKYLEEFFGKHPECKPKRHPMH